MNRLLIALAVLAAVTAAAAVAVRLVPPAPGWHSDPATVVPPASPNRWLLRDGGGGDAPALRLPQPPEAVAARLAQVAGATPRTRLLAGEGLFTTWLTRSRLMGFPDTTSVLIRPDGTGSEVLIYARSIIGRSDLGVNRARAEAWAAALAAP
jgi:hypothetical protein